MTEIRGERVSLRPLSESDTDYVLRWRCEPAVASQMFSDRPPTREEHQSFLERLKTSGDRVEFVIIPNDDDKPVGTVGLSRIDPAASEAEYGILIGDRHALGRGIAREASELILNHAFGVLNLQRVTLNVFADNEPAIALYHRLGFRDDPQNDSTREKDGVVRRVLRMTIERV